MKKDPRVYLAQILERIDRIVRYTDKGKFLNENNLMSQQIFRSKPSGNHNAQQNPPHGNGRQKYSTN
jgi:hypothetical protein